MTPSQISAMYTKMNLVKFSSINDNAITTGIEDTGNGFYIVKFATKTGKVLQIKGKGKGSAPYLKMPKIA